NQRLRLVAGQRSRVSGEVAQRQRGGTVVAESFRQRQRLLGLRAHGRPVERVPRQGRRGRQRESAPRCVVGRGGERGIEPATSLVLVPRQPPEAVQVPGQARRLPWAGPQRPAKSRPYVVV